jgi:tungstate transport system substrate-binding protein
LVILLTACNTTNPQASTEDQTQEETSAETSTGETPGSGLTLATTTSTYDSGLLDTILPVFEEESGITVEVVAVGTGQALALGEQGDADVLLVHAREREDAFMEAGHGVRREDVMYNDFVIVGPQSDPAGVAGVESVAEALASIAASEAVFVSRGDDSGTHTKEKAVWESAGIEPAGDWYQSIGQGMGATLTFANEENGYTLSDRATYLARTIDDEGFELAILVEGDPILFNPYGVMAVNPEKSDLINAEGANQFIDWLVSLPTQELIAEFGKDKFGSPLFTPDSEAWRAAQ